MSDREIRRGSISLKKKVMGEENQNSARSTHTNIAPNDQETTPLSIAPTSSPDSENYDYSCEPRNFRPINDIYNNIEVVEMDEELILMGVGEPTTYSQSTKKGE